MSSPSGRASSAFTFASSGAASATTRGSGASCAVGMFSPRQPVTFQAPPSRVRSRSTWVTNSPQRPGWATTVAPSRCGGMLRWVWPVSRRSIPGSCASRQPKFSLSVPSGAPVARSRSNPLWTTTMTTSARLRSSGTRAAATATGSAKVSPRQCSGGSQCGMLGLVRPRMPMRTPPRSITNSPPTGSLACSAPPRLAASHGNFACAIERRSTSRPKLNSWLPRTTAS